jgi:regulatory protein
MNKERSPREITPEYLKRSALFHLQKFDTTVGGLRAVLQRRVLKNCLQSGKDPEDYVAMIEDAVKHCSDRSYVDDERYTERFVESSTSKGLSKRQIEGKMYQKGVNRELVERALEDSDYDEFSAAEAYARKKRIGKFRRENRDDFIQKDLAAMARRGFSYEICSKLIDGDIDDDPSPHY